MNEISKIDISQDKEWMKNEFALVIKKNSEIWLGFIYNTFGTQQTAFEPNDLIQDVCSEVFGKIESGKIIYDPKGKLPFPDYLKNIVLTTIRNRGIDKIRREERRKGVHQKYGNAQSQEVQPEDDPCALFICRERSALVAQLLLGIKEQNRKVICMFIFESRSFPEIAEILDLKVSTVKSQYQRGIKYLGEHISNPDSGFSILREYID